MTDISERLHEIKKKMRRRLCDLNKEEKQLKVEAETLRKSMAHLGNLLEEIEAGITQQRLKEIVAELNLKVRVIFPFTGLAKYFVLKHLNKKLKEMRLMLDRIPYKMKKIESERESVNICPVCDGVGSQVQRRYIREDGIVTPITTSKGCPLCHGKGTIDLDEK